MGVVATCAPEHRQRAVDCQLDGVRRPAEFLFFYLKTAKLLWRLLGVSQAGTLEQVYLSPLPAWLVATAGVVLATVVETAVLIAIGCR
ncbi:MAG TPA: hypothetical protein VGL99_17290 [Chloroflexota bacterium]|jgi:hypothetical protein